MIHLKHNKLYVEYCGVTDIYQDITADKTVTKVAIHWLNLERLTRGILRFMQIFFVSTYNACYSVINDRTAACTRFELLDLEYLLGSGGR